MKQYIVVAQRIEDTGNGHNTRQLPAFILDGNIQGIVSVAHADRIAREILAPVGNVSYSISVTEV